MVRFITYLASLLLVLHLCSCGNSCEDIPKTFNTYEDAIEEIQQSSFKIKEDYTVSNSSWINSIHYYSCDSKSGYLIVEMKRGNYIHQNIPIDIWLKFKEAESKGTFYNNVIKGNYKLQLNDN